MFSLGFRGYGVGGKLPSGVIPTGVAPLVQLIHSLVLSSEPPEATNWKSPSPYLLSNSKASLKLRDKDVAALTDKV